MATNNPYSQYKQNSIMTATPQELCLMLYKGAMKFIKQSIIYMENGDIEKSHNSNIRAQDIFVEFMSTVDRSYGIGENLFNLYEYMNYRLQEANIQKDEEMLGEVYEMTKELSETWEEAIKIAKKKG